MWEEVRRILIRLIIVTLRAAAQEVRPLEAAAAVRVGDTAPTRPLLEPHSAEAEAEAE